MSELKIVLMPNSNTELTIKNGVVQTVTLKNRGPSLSQFGLMGVNEDSRMKMYIEFDDSVPVSAIVKAIENAHSKHDVPVTTASRSPTWALGAVYVSEEEYQRLKG